MPQHFSDKWFLEFKNLIMPSISWLSKVTFSKPQPGGRGQGPQTLWGPWLSQKCPSEKRRGAIRLVPRLFSDSHFSEGQSDETTLPGQSFWRDPWRLPTSWWRTAESRWSVPWAGSGSTCRRASDPSRPGTSRSDPGHTIRTCRLNEEPDSSL